MASFDRSKFAAPTKEAIQAQTESAEKPASSGSGNGMTYHKKFKKGTTWLRLFPIHPLESELVGDKATGIINKKQYFLPAEEKGKKMVSLCANTHGDGSEGNCIIGAYVQAVKNQANRFYKKDSPDFIEDETKAQAECRAHKDSGIFAQGDNLKPLGRWITYSKRYETEEDAINNTNGVLGQEELPTSVKNQLAAQSTKNPNKFMDVNSGVVVEVTYDPSKDPADMYKALSLEDADDNIVKTALSDEDLDWFMAIERPATVSLRGCYTKDAFDKAIDGLKRFDEAHPQYNVFSEDAFLDKCEKISNYWESKSENKEEGSDLPF